MPMGAFSKANVVLRSFTAPSVAEIVLDGVDCGFGKSHAEARGIFFGSRGSEGAVVVSASKTVDWLKWPVVSLGAEDVLF